MPLCYRVVTLGQGVTSLWFVAWMLQEVREALLRRMAEGAVEEAAAPPPPRFKSNAEDVDDDDDDDDAFLERFRQQRLSELQVSVKDLIVPATRGEG